MRVGELKHIFAQTEPLEFSLKTDGKYPRDVGGIRFKMAHLASELQFNIHLSAQQVFAFTRLEGPRKKFQSPV